MPRTSPGPHPGRAVAARGRELRARLRRGQPGHRGVGAALRQRARHRHHHPHQHEPVAAGVPGDRRLRPARAVRGGGRRRAVPRARHPPPRPRPLQRGRRGQAALERGGRHLRHPAAAPAPGGDASGRGPARPAWGSSSSPPSSRACCATDAVSTPAASARPGSRAATPRPGRSTASSAPSACVAAWATPRPSYTYSQDIEQFFRHSPGRGPLHRGRLKLRPDVRRGRSRTTVPAFSSTRGVLDPDPGRAGQWRAKYTYRLTRPGSGHVSWTLFASPASGVRTTTPRW